MGKHGEVISNGTTLQFSNQSPFLDSVQDISEKLGFQIDSAESADIWLRDAYVSNGATLLTPKPLLEDEDEDNAFKAKQKRVQSKFSEKLFCSPILPRSIRGGANPEALKLEYKNHQIKTIGSTVEGGNCFLVEDKNGTKKAIIGINDIINTAASLFSLEEINAFSEEKLLNSAKNQIAKDLDLDPQNVLVIPQWSYHIDLQIAYLGDGNFAVHSFDIDKDALTELLKSDGVDEEHIQRIIDNFINCKKLYETSVIEPMISLLTNASFNAKKVIGNIFYADEDDSIDKLGCVFAAMMNGVTYQGNEKTTFITAETPLFKFKQNFAKQLEQLFNVSLETVSAKPDRRAMRDLNQLEYMDKCDFNDEQIQAAVTAKYITQDHGSLRCQSNFIYYKDVIKKIEVMEEKVKSLEQHIEELQQCKNRELTSTDPKTQDKVNTCIDNKLDRIEQPFLQNLTDVLPQQRKIKLHGKDYAIKQLGEGVDGFVHLAQNLDVNKPDQIVIKSPRIKSSRNDYFAQRELDYYNTAYPNLEVCLINTSNKINTEIELQPPLLIMPYLGQSLAKKLEKASQEEALELFSKVALEIDRLHTQCNIVHRDIRWENILINDEGKVFIIDGSYATKAGLKVSDTFNETFSYEALPLVAQTIFTDEADFDEDIKNCYYHMDKWFLNNNLPTLFSGDTTSQGLLVSLQKVMYQQNLHRLEAALNDKNAFLGDDEEKLLAQGKKIIEQVKAIAGEHLEKLRFNDLKDLNNVLRCVHATVQDRYDTDKSQKHAKEITDLAQHVSGKSSSGWKTLGVGLAIFCVVLMIVGIIVAVPPVAAALAAATGIGFGVLASGVTAAGASAGLSAGVSIGIGTGIIGTGAIGSGAIGAYAINKGQEKGLARSISSFKDVVSDMNGMVTKNFDEGLKPDTESEIEDVILTATDSVDAQKNQDKEWVDDLDAINPLESMQAMLVQQQNKTSETKESDKNELVGVLNKAPINVPEGMTVK